MLFGHHFFPWLWRCCQSITDYIFGQIGDKKNKTLCEYSVTICAIGKKQKIYNDRLERLLVVCDRAGFRLSLNNRYIGVRKSERTISAADFRNGHCCTVCNFFGRYVSLCCWFLCTNSSIFRTSIYLFFSDNRKPARSHTTSRRSRRSLYFFCFCSVG